MPADTSVKYFHSAMPGAPTLSGQAGTLIAVLDACLVNGFGSGTLDTLVVASNVATATRAAGHPFEIGTVVEIAGATPAGLNGKHKVTAVTTTTYQFETSSVSDGAATGTITHKLAALGWVKQFSGTNLAAYKSSDVESTGCLLRMDDTGTRTARCVGYETMADINTGTGPFPTSAQQSGGYYWVKSETANATTRPWFIVGDERLFYMWTHYGDIINFGDTYITQFGDFNSQVPGDAYGCSLNGQSTDRSGFTSDANCFTYASGSTTSNNGSLALARRFNGLGSAWLGARLLTPAQANQNALSGHSGSAGSGLGYPNAADNALYVGPYYVGDGGCVRGIWPGAYFVPHSISSTQFTQRERIESVGGLSGRTLLAISCENGPMMFDITGPWRT